MKLSGLDYVEGRIAHFNNRVRVSFYGNYSVISGRNPVDKTLIKNEKVSINKGEPVDVFCSKIISSGGWVGLD